ncbi:hypothetical protein [Pseudoroseomonas cervicalis]|uniref:hypothetical protein n=1 Tax=Teichococcus cervicalis TaxID=204525 RepID=UPI0022F1B9E9|nr:hypothetical protein [Pseudoroseomonas cervicalis]WBV42712.1 hypothetical protein PFY06_15930 [Pseudoroseomonas cervicalis]
MPDTQSGGLREQMQRPAMTVAQLLGGLLFILPGLIFARQIYADWATANAQAVQLQERQSQTLVQLSAQLAEQRQMTQQFVGQAAEMRGLIVELRTQTAVLQRDSDRQREDTDRRFEATRQSIQQLRDLIARMALQPRGQSDSPPIADTLPLPGSDTGLIWRPVLRLPLD